MAIFDFFFQWTRVLPRWNFTIKITTFVWVQVPSFWESDTGLSVPRQKVQAETSLFWVGLRLDTDNVDVWNYLL